MREFSKEATVKVTPEDGKESVGKAGRVGDIQAQEVVCAKSPDLEGAQHQLCGRSAEKWGAWPERALDRQAEARLWS